MALPLTTDAPDRAALAPARDTAQAFLIGRLGSLFAFLPLGVWTVNHLWDNLAAFNGPAAWQREVTGHSSTAAQALTATLVLAPLLWHTGWGLARMARSRPAPTTPYFSNLRYLLQRLSALGLLLFIGAHLYLAWFEPRFVKGHAEEFRHIAHEMRTHAPTLIVYLLGVLGTAYHLANGVWSFAMGWGLAVSKSALAWVEKLSIALFAVLLAMGWGAIYALWAAGGR